MYRIEAFDTNQWKRWTVGILHTEDPEQAQRFCDEHSTGTLTMRYFGVKDLDAKPLPKTLWVASWLPAKRPQKNENDDETPRFGLRHTEDGAYEEAAYWVQDYSGVIAAHAEAVDHVQQHIPGPVAASRAGLAKAAEQIKAAIEADDARAIVRLYNEHNKEGWYIYISETPVGVQLSGPQKAIVKEMES